MDVRLPDGTIIKNIPEGTTRAQLVGKLKSNGYAVPAEWLSAAPPAPRQPDALDQAKPTDGMSTADKFWAGAGKAVADTGRSLGQLARGALPNRAADALGLPTQADIDEAARLDGALMKTTAGTVGNIGGQIALAVTPGVAGLSTVGKAGALWKAGGAANVARSLGMTAAEGAAQNVAMTPRTSDDSLIGQVAGGAAMGAGAQVLGAGAVKAIQYGREAFRPAGATGRTLSKAGQTAPGNLAAAIRAGNTTLVPGSAPTVSQAVPGNTGLAQLTRVVRAQGSNAYETRMADQNTARLAALNGISEVTGTAAEAANNAGGAIYREAKPAYDAARANTSALYTARDPFGEARLGLPLGPVDETMAKYFGAGAGAPPGELGALVADIKALGTVTEAPAAAAKARTLASGGARPSASKAIDVDRDPLDVAIRKLGGVNIGAGGGELRWLRESDLGKSSVVHGPLARRDGGHNWDILAQRAHEYGYIDEADPALLMDKLAESARGAPVMSMHGGEETLAAARGYYDDMPEELLQPLQTPGVVDLETLTRLRSRAGELAYKSGLAGDKRAASAAGQIRNALDQQLDDTASRAGQPGGVPGEFFAPDMAEANRAAKAARTDQARRFETGFAGRLWTDGADGMPKLTGGEIPRAAFNSGATQAQDIAQWALMGRPGDDALKNYAITGLVENAAPNGLLSADKVGKWTRGRSEALKGLLNDGERATLGSVNADLARAAQADTAGKALGSNTVQNLLNRGLLDGPIGKAARVAPFVGDRVDALADLMRGQRAERLGQTLLDPEEAARALLTFEALQRRNRAQQAVGLLGRPSVGLPVLRGGYGLLNTED